jgi:signal transduction histidine kinase
VKNLGQKLSKAIKMAIRWAAHDPTRQGDCMTLRLRLALFIGVLIALAVIVQGAIGYARFEGLGIAEADRSLRDFIESQLRPQRRGGRGDRPDNRPPLLETDPNIRARLRVAEITLENFNTVFPEITPTKLGYSTLGTWRVLVLELPPNRRLEAAISLNAQRQGQANYLATLFLTVPLLAGVGGLAAWLVSAQALKPLEALIHAQQRVADSGNLSERVAHQAGKGELERLSSTFNQMLERLQNFREREVGFTRTAAHELRTPLTAIQAQLDAHAQGWVSTEEALTTTRNQVTRMSKLSEALLVLAREGRTERLDFDLGQMLAELAAKHGAVYIGATSLHWQGNPVLLERAVENLLENAAKHAPNTAITLQLETGNNGLEIQVSDQGQGMKPEDLAQATQAFFRAAGTKAYGSGLGLAVVQRIAQAHGGGLRLENAQPQGLRAVLEIG